MQTPTQMAEKLRKIAESCGKEAAKKRSRGLYNQNPTRRRMNMLEGIEADARRLERMQGWALGLAELWSKGECPTALYGLATKVALEIFATYSEWPTWKADYLIGLGISQPMYLGVLQALEHYSAPVNQEKPIDREIRDRKRALVGVPIPGFFPTPEPVIQRMLELAQIRPYMTVLEPSAGWGNIADAILADRPDARLILFEIAPRLCEILELKGYCGTTIGSHNLFFRDFLAAEPGAITGYTLVDRVLMNPEFENLADIDHIKHAYTWLKPGGRLVSVVSESPFFRRERKAEQFREWLHDRGAHDERLPEGSFAKGERPTNVATRLIVVDKPACNLY